MRHRISQKKLNRTSEHRRAMHRNMAQSLIQHGQVTTTIAKAKDIRPYVERLITLAVRVRQSAGADPAASLRARRQIHRLLGDRALIPAEHLDDYTMMSDAGRNRALRMRTGRRYRTGEPKGRMAFTAESAIHRLIEKVAPRFEDRPGGYTRLIKLARRRKGDNTELAMVQLIGGEEAPTSLTKPKKTSRQRKADARYAAAIKASKQRRDSGKAKAEEPTEVEPEAQAEDTSPTEGGEESSKSE